MTEAGKVFDIFLIFLGVGSAAYVFASFTRFIVEGEMQRYFGRRRLDKTIMRMSNHYIICGNGRIGSLICQELLHSNKTFLVIDKDPVVIEHLERTGVPHILGDASDEDILTKSGIKRAKGLIATASSDMTNVYIILIAKELNPESLCACPGRDRGFHKEPHEGRGEQGGLSLPHRRPPYGEHHPQTYRGGLH